MTEVPVSVIRSRGVQISRLPLDHKHTRAHTNTQRLESECPLTIHSLIIVPMSSPIGRFLLNQANWFNVSGQSGYHGGQLVFSYPASFSTFEKKRNKRNSFVALHRQVGKSVKIMRSCSADKCCVHMTAQQLAERTSSGWPISPVYCIHTVSSHLSLTLLEFVIS